MNKKKAKILRIGFDLDGVLLYNPARIARPIIVFFKKLFLPKEQKKFHLPKTKLQKFIWYLLHKSSFIPAKGIDEIKSLVKSGRIEAYIISARYESLKLDFNSWIKKIDGEKYFTEIYYNNQDEQPYLFKEKMIKRLKLDIFVEDNWDIVSHLSEKTPAKIYWIYNLLDIKIDYKYKFPTLRKVLSRINNQVSK